MDNFIIETISWRICAIFLSRIRDEQEAVAWIYQHEDTGQVGFVDQQQIDWGFEKHNPRLQVIGPLFTTPPAAQECKDLEMIKRMMEAGTADSFMSLTDEQKRMAFAVGIRESTLRKRLSESCSELVGALELIRKGDDSPRTLAMVALANHAKRMKGEE